MGPVINASQSFAERGRAMNVIRGLRGSDIGMFRRLNYVLQTLFGGKRNLYDVFGYTYNPTYDQKFFKYLRQDIAGRVVDAPASALWTNPPLITSTDELWNTRWDDLIARHNLWSIVERCDRLAGIGRYAILIIGFNDGQDLSRPVNTRSTSQKSNNNILFLQPYSERCAEIIKYNQDAQSEDFGKPELYRIYPMNDFTISWNGKTVPAGKNRNASGSFEVHASRVIHLAENCMENEVFGSPRIERVYNLLDDLLKVVGGSAETFWLTGNRGIHIDIDKEMEMDAEDAKNLTAEVEEYQHQQRRFIRTRGGTVKNLGTDVADPTGVFNVLIAMLSGATGIPKRILIGAEAGQLASEQDRANWADRIDERRANWANPYVIFEVIKKLAKARYLPTPDNVEITVEWPSSFKMSPLEDAQTSAQHARSATNFAKAIETMENLKRGKPAQEAQLDDEGNPIPGTEKAAVPGSTFDEDLITIPEARKFIGLDKYPVTFDSGEDIAQNQKNGEPRRQYSRRVQISQSRILRISQ